MKKNLAYGLCTMLLLSACSNDMKDVVDNVSLPQSGLQYMEFTASTGTDTRTQLRSDNNVVWRAGDEISIFDGTGNRKFTTNNTGTNAAFAGYAADAGNYYALYPYQEGATLSGNVIRNVTLPSEQTAKARSFDAACNLSVATASSNLQFVFDNVCSLVKFSVNNSQASKVRKVKLTSLDAAVLSGTFNITLGNQPTATPTSGQQPSVTLIAENGMEAGQYYYFAVLPSVLNAGFSLTFFDEQGNTWQKDYTKEANMASSNILNLATIEVGAFSYSLTNANLIAAAEASTGRTFAKNADGTVSLSNDDNYQIAMAVTSLDISYKKDPSICEEIGVFSNLKYLNCYSNDITSLDLSKNTALTELSCGYNQLTSLDLTNNTALTGLNCSSNQLTSLDLSKNTALTGLWCNGNQLTSLDLSKNTKLTNLDCNSNQLTSLGLSKNTKLTNLDCNSNQLTSLNINSALTYLDCHSNQLTSLYINSALTKLYCYDNQLTSLNLTNNTALTELDCYDNQLTSLKLTWNTNLTNLDCHSNQLTSLDLTDCTALTDLECYDNQLTSLDLTDCTALTDLECYDNQLTSLNLTNNTALTELDCYDNQLTSLDISNNSQINCSTLHVGSQKNNQTLVLCVSDDQYLWADTILKNNKNVDVVEFETATVTHHGFDETTHIGFIKSNKD